MYGKLVDKTHFSLTLKQLRMTGARHQLALHVLLCAAQTSPASRKNTHRQHRWSRGECCFYIETLLFYASHPIKLLHNAQPHHDHMLLLYFTQVFKGSEAESLLALRLVGLFLKPAVTFSLPDNAPLPHTTRYPFRPESPV